MGWSVVDSCDVVRLNQQQKEAMDMAERFKTDGTRQLVKSPTGPGKVARGGGLEEYPGPGSPVLHPSMQSNGFTEYANAGGMSRKQQLKGQINSVAKLLAEAKNAKGTLCLNNGKPNGGTWKTPALDIALNSKSGFKGGETGQRFYMKFPIYRPRGGDAPGVRDDIDAVWKTQITPMAPSDHRLGGGLTEAAARGRPRSSRRNKSVADRGTL